MTTIKTAFVYIRVSNPNALSYEAQLKAIQEYAARNQIETTTIYSDEGNALKALERPGIKKMLEDVIKTPVDHILVYDGNRLTRRDADYRTIRSILEAFDISIVRASRTITIDSPMDEFLENMERTLGRLDSERRSEMVKRRMRQRAEAGYSMQRPPLGYSTSLFSGLYIKNVDASAMKYYFNRAIYGELTASELRYALAKIYSETNSISKKRLLKLVSNPYYIGLISYDGQLFNGLHEPLLTKEEQDKLVGLLS